MVTADICRTVNPEALPIEEVLEMVVSGGHHSSAVAMRDHAHCER